MPMTDSDVKALQPKKRKYSITSGHGLLVHVYPNGSKYFIWEYKFVGERNTYHIGRYGNVSEGLWSLKKAREEKFRLDTLRKQGHDPQLLKKTEKQEIKDTGTYTFEKVASEWLGSRKGRSADATIEDYRNKLENQILPTFAKLSIKRITRPECIAFMRSHEKRAPEQARKLLMVMRMVFEYAIDMDWMEDSNPARSSKNTTTNHSSKSLPSLKDWNLVPPFLVAVTENKCRGEYQTNIAVKLAALTFVRASSLVSARWVDIDFDNKLWTIPADKMKGKREHITPMSDPVIELFMKLKQINGDEEYCFYSPRGKKYPYLNPSSPNHHIKNLGGEFEGKLVTHGLRAMAMTHGREKLKYDFEVIDLQLGHLRRDKIRKAYDRTSFIKERTDFMDDWAELLLENGLQV